MKKLFILLFSACLSQVSASVNIQFYEPYFGGIASSLANAAGLATNNMRWGVIVDTTGNGFANSGTSYDAFAGGPASNGFFGANGVTTDDYYIAGALTQDGSTLYPNGDFDGVNFTTPGSGSIIDDLIVPDFSTISGMGASDKFALVWFSTNSSAVGDKYGFFTDVSFILPTDGSPPTSFGAPFAGTDPVRTASNTFQNPSLVPEPSRVMFLALGGLGLLMRRRRG